MAGHFLTSREARNFSQDDVARMSDREVFNMFVRMRWGTSGKQACPSCGVLDRHYFLAGRKQWRCKDISCGHTFSVTSGTKFADHKLPLRKLLGAIAVYVTNSKGMSAVQFGQSAQISYQTAFTLMHKLRETIIEHRDETPVSGVVHVDGAHFGGRMRKPRQKRKKTDIPLRARQGRTAYPQHPNRRIVMVLREVSPIPGAGGARSIVEIVPAEDEIHCSRLGEKYIERNSTVMTDESPAYGRYARQFSHKTVNHTRQFSTAAGVSNNHAESFFTRARRFVIGQVHRMTPKYIFDYMNEIAWREDNRRVSPKMKAEQLLQMSLRSGESRWWRGYCQGKNRATEIIFPR